jgi:hypothetical protein
MTSPWRIRLVAPILAITTSALLAPVAMRAASGCMLVGAADTKIRGEEVLIVWNAATRTEHFVRHLSFADAAHDFGFLVPTPTRPELGEVDDGLFAHLFTLYRAPPTRSRSRSMDGPGPHASNATRAVEVVEQRRVAGLDATVLRATDPSALAAWLSEHHYASTPALTAYLAPYVQRGGYVTAFRYEPAGAERRFGTRALRMTFQSDAPFFPYAEPSDAPAVPGRVFRVSVISNERVEGRVGANAWTARTAYAGHPSFSMLERDLPANALRGATWLTTYQEDNSRRGRDDLTFVRARDQREVTGRLNQPVD